MRARDARLIVEETAAWERDGVISAAQRQAITERYAAAASAADFGGSAIVLHALGGLVLGAAAIALVVLLDLQDQAASNALLVLGALLTAVGLALALSGRALGDAAAVAGLVPLTFAPMGAKTSLLAFAVPFAAGPVVAGLRRGVLYTPPLGAIAFAVGTGIALAARFEDGWTVLWSTLLIGGMAAATWFARDAGVTGPGAAERAERSGGWDAACALLAVALAIGGALMYFADLNLNWGNGGAELLVGALMLGVVAAGVLLRQRGLLVGGTIALATDAVVFAFDVGGVLFGVVTLLAVAGALLAAASALRRFVAS